jgi:hypothetical protein
MKQLLCAVLSAVACGGAAGQVSTIGPFVGPHTEGFESQPASTNTMYSCLPGRIFNNTASICEPTHSSLTLPTSWSMFCAAVPHQGSRYAVGQEGWIEINFDSPATAFGGYFATIGGIDGGEVAFANASGTVGAVSFNTNQCQWTWQGWSSSTPFTRVRIYGLGIIGSGGYIHVDDLQYQGSQPCYANCDGGTSIPQLTAGDFQCFINRFVTGDSYANCDGSVAVPALNILDFQCFMARYAAGCQ